jgi:hypothetical protein
MGLLSTIGAASARAYGFTRSAIAAAVDAYFNRVTLLLPGNGTNGAQNNTFLDSSTNNFTITRNGNTTQGTFSPFSQTGWGNYFDGSSSYLSCSSNAKFGFGTGTYSIEAWVFKNTSGTYKGIFGNGSIATGSLAFYISNTETVSVDQYGTSGLGTTATIPIGVWTHVLVTRDSATNGFRIFIDGVLRAYTTSTFNNTSTNCLVGLTYTNDTAYMNGYISNIRVIKGSIPTSYQTSSTTVGTSVFTPPTSALTTSSQGATAADVSLLTCQSNRFIDNSTNAFAITVNGTPSIQAFSPFAPTAAYSAATNGGSGYSDGSGDYLTVATNANLTLGSSDFTIELWWYPLAFNSDGEIFTMGSTGGTNRCYAMYSSGSNGTLAAFAGTGSTTWDIVSNLSMGTAIKNAWNHMAFTRSGSTFSTYLNGVRIATTTATGTLGSNALGIFANNSGTSQAPNSYIGGARTIKGTALYTGATYTVPTTPFTAVTNTNFLANFTNAGITDATAKNVLETVGNAQISTTQSKFGGASMSFDGSSTVPMPARQTLALGSGNWTIECWVRLGSTGTETTIGQSKNYYTAGFNGNFVFRVGTSNLWRSFDGQSSQATIDGTYSWSTGQWYHVAWVRNGSTVTVYRDGTSLGSTTDSKTLNDSANGITLGSSLNAYVDDLRITVGVARYTANFTAPTVAFPLS